MCFTFKAFARIANQTFAIDAQMRKTEWYLYVADLSYTYRATSQASETFILCMCISLSDGPSINLTACYVRLALDVDKGRLVEYFMHFKLLACLHLMHTRVAARNDTWWTSIIEELHSLAGDESLHFTTSKNDFDKRVDCTRTFISASFIKRLIDWFALIKFIFDVS